MMIRKVAFIDCVMKVRKSVNGLSFLAIGM